MVVANGIPTRSIVERDVWRLNLAAVAYVVGVLIVGILVLDQPVWLVVAAVLPVIALYVAGARFATGRMLHRLADGVVVELVGHGIPPAIARHLPPLSLDGFEPPVMVRRTSVSGELLIPDVAFFRRADGGVVLSVARHVTIARSRLDDGRWVITQPGEAYPVPGVLVQSVPGRQRHEVLARHDDALRIAAACGRSVRAIDVVTAAGEIEDIHTEVIREMSASERRQAARRMLDVPPLKLLGADAF